MPMAILLKNSLNFLVKGHGLNKYSLKTMEVFRTLYLMGLEALVANPQDAARSMVADQ